MSELSAKHIDAAFASLEDEDKLKASLDAFLRKAEAVLRENIILLDMGCEVHQLYKAVHAAKGDGEERAYAIAQEGIHPIVDTMIDDMLEKNKAWLPKRLLHTRGTAPLIKDLIDYGLKHYRESL